MDNLFIMNQSVSCEVCVSELQQWNASIGLIKVLLKSKLKMYTKHGVPVHGQPLLTTPGSSESFEVDGWFVKVSSQRWAGGTAKRQRHKPLGRGLGACSPGKFLHLDALKCCFLHSPGYFLSIITKNPENKLCSLPSNLVGEWWYFILKMPPVKKCQAE